MRTKGIRPHNSNHSNSRAPARLTAQAQEVRVVRLVMSQTTGTTRQNTNQAQAANPQSAALVVQRCN
jgi:hypothetical protein